MKSKNKIFSTAVFLGILVLSASCSSTKSNTPARSSADGSQQVQVQALNSQIAELKEMLRIALQDAADAKLVAEQAQATADAAQEMSAATDDRLEQMFERSVFK